MKAATTRWLHVNGRLLTGLLLMPVLSLAEEANLLHNGSFELGANERGVPVHWEGGRPNSLRLVDEPVAAGRHALRIERGGIAFQTVPVQAGRLYMVTLRAVTPFVEEPKAVRYRSYVRLELVPLPSGKKARRDIVSPFGNGTEFIPNALGLRAAEGTKRIRVTLSSTYGPCTIDDVQLVTYEDSSTHFRLKDLHLETELVRNGKSAARVVVPKSGLYDGSASKIVAKVRELTGFEQPVLRDADLDICGEQSLATNLVVLGNRSTSRVVSDFYDLYHVILDLRYPGKGGSVVRSLHDPFGDGHNVIFVGASDEAGMAKATAAFLRVLDEASAGGGSLTIGHLAKIELGSNVKIPETMTFNELRGMKPWGATNRTGGYGWTVISKTMSYYYLTGYESYAKELMRLAFPKDDQTLKDLASCGQDFRGAATMHEPLVNVYHYRAHLPVVYWDLIEESPFFTDEDRAKITLQFMKQVRHFSEAKNMGCEADTCLFPPKTVSTRHHSWAAMTFYTLGRYLSKSYPDYEWKRVKRSAEYFFSALYAQARVHNRGESSRLERLSTTLDAPFEYTLLSGRKEPLQVGSLHDQVRNLEILLDWKGNSWILRQTPTNLFNQMAYLLNEGRYATMRNLIRVSMPYFRPGRSFWPDKSALPTTPFGIDRWEIWRPTPEEQTFWSLLWEEPLREPERIARAASYRTSNDGRGDFLLLDAVHLGGIYHCFSLLEHVMDGDVLLLGQRTHLGFMSEGMAAAKQPKYALLKRHAAVGHSAAMTGLAPDFSFADWTRTILHRAGEYTLVVDGLTSRRNADVCNAEINWQLAPEAEPVLLGDGVAVIRPPINTDGPGAFELSALGDASVVFASNLPPENILRSSYDAVTLKNETPGSWLTITFELGQQVEGDLLAVFITGTNRGLVKVELDGQALAEHVNCHSMASGRLPKKIPLGRRRLSAGRHVLRLESLGPAPEGAAAFISFRALQVIGEVTPRDYVIGSADKTPMVIRDVGRAVGSSGAGGCLTATWYGSLGEGRTKLFFSLISRKTGAADMDAGQCLRLADSAAVLGLPKGSALAVCGAYEGVQADVAVVGTDHLAAYGVTHCGDFLRSSKPAHVDWSFSAGELVVETAAACQVVAAIESDSVELSGTGKARREGKNVVLDLEAGRHTIRRAKPRAALVAAHAKRCGALFARAVAARKGEAVIKEREVTVSASEIVRDWTAATGVFPHDLKAFEHDGQTLVAVAVGSKVVIYDARGTVRHRLATDAMVKSLHYWPEPGLLTAGCHDFKVVAFDPASGRRRWVFESTEINPIYRKQGHTGWFDRNPRENRGIHALSSGVFLDGQEQLFVGTASTVEALDREGRLVKSMAACAGVVTDVAVLDCGEGEVRLFPARLFGRFMFAQSINTHPDEPRIRSVGEFSPRRGAATYIGEYGSGYADVEAVDLDGNGKQELVGLFNGGLNGIHVWDREGKVVGDAAFGDGRTAPRGLYQQKILPINMRGLGFADLDGDGTKELLVITSRGFVIALTRTCEKLWAKRLPSEPLSLAAFAASAGAPVRVAVGCRGGGVFSLDAKGAFVGQQNMGNAVTKMAALDATRVVAADVEGTLHALKIR